MKVSKFQNIYSMTVYQVDLLEELEDIRQGKYKTIIQKCRLNTSSNNYDVYKSLKIKLPIVTFCGTFINGRKLKDLDVYNNLMILDIDHIETSEVQSTKNILKKDDYIFSVWLSPSGEGLKALVKLKSSPSEHKSSFDSLKHYFQSNYNIELDNSGSDVTRLCFVSWDDDLYLNSDSKIYTDKIVELESKGKNINREPINKSLSKSAFATEGLNKQEHRKQIGLIIKYLKRKNFSITNSFDEWFRVAVAIASAFSYDVGEKYYLSLCELDKERHNELESKNLLKYCYNNRNFSLPTTISLGTIVFYAKEKGFVTKKDKFSI
ncbi:hypothetical protein D1816_03900 [Aquimarina sp. AD10]|uniref:BT4734/BF3469 family protein n=1 Tax=Aquimarina sp. AD10 TaxID=1714849 RepID=UPI000E544A5C|nr:BT4734/BF3469 family protein [Aquimarina sp. AD10]AXT59531.1 hypothetical protein D1816_03900 [Aquimarina sp. AD10]RKN00432.1 hypothetical protein D7033_08730 [Aquimarina sp. AD10]